MFSANLHPEVLLERGLPLTAVNPVYEGAVPNNNSLMIPYEDLYSALDLATEFNKDERPLRGEYFRRDFEDFRKAVSEVSGYLGVFGTGYPFYAQRPDGSVFPIAEVSRYIGSFREKLDADAAKALGAWPCAACQVELELPDLKQYCKPCDAVEFKPRDLFRALPDADFWVVVDAIDSNTEQAIEDQIRASGFYTSDESISRGLTKTSHVMRSIANGIMPNDRLPIDLHVVERSQLLDSMRQVPANIAQASGSVPITPRSLHVKWEDADSPYDFTKDFLFSLTEFDWRDRELTDALADARHHTRSLLLSSVVSYVANIAPKEARQLETESVRYNLERRIAAWPE